MPYEAEDIYARAVPTYRHRKGHAYDILPATISDGRLLRCAVETHTREFNRRRFLTKSPFNDFRVRRLEHLFGTAMRYIHVDRSPDQVSSSLARNRFVFHHDGRELSPRQAYDLFTSAILANVPPERTRSVTLEDLRASPEQIITDLLAWLDESCSGTARLTRTAHTGRTRRS